MNTPARRPLAWLAAGRTAALVALALALAATPAFAAESGTGRASGLGQLDFIEYWSACRVCADGGDPYSPEAMRQVETAAGREGVPLMMWNAPWTMSLFLPFTAGRPFDEAATRWIFAGLLMVAASALLWTLPRSRDAVQAVTVAASFVVFFPVLHNLAFGQLGALLGLGWTLALLGFQRRSGPLLGLGLALVSVKPHLFVLVLPLMFATLLLERRWSWIAWTLAAIGLLSVAPLAMCPQAFGSWFDIVVLGLDVDGAPAPRGWLTNTLVGAIRWHGRDVLPDALLSAAGLVPWITLAVVTAALLRARRRPDVDLLLPLSAVSMLTAPFGWLFDQVALLPLHLSTVALLLERGRAGTLAAVVAYQAVPLAIVFGVADVQQHWFWWYPLGMLAFWRLAERAPGR